MPICRYFGRVATSRATQDVAQGNVQSGASDTRGVRQALIGTGWLLLSVALAATVTGGALLVVVWILLALIGLGLVVTSTPVRDRVPWISRRAWPELKLSIRPDDETWHVFAPDFYKLASRSATKGRLSRVP